MIFTTSSRGRREYSLPCAEIVHKDGPSGSRDCAYRLSTFSLTYIYGHPHLRSRVRRFAAYPRRSSGPRPGYQRQSPRHSGLGLEAQRQTVADFLNGGRWTLNSRVHRGRERQTRPVIAKIYRHLRIAETHLRFLVFFLVFLKQGSKFLGHGRGGGLATTAFSSACSGRSPLSQGTGEKAPR